VAQQAKANALAPRPRLLALVRASFTQRRIQPFIHFLTPFSVLAAPLGGAAAAEGQGALSALDVDSSSCGADRARSRPAKIIKGAKILIEDAGLSAELGAVPCVAPLPAGRFVVP
jgi:hypothetical protein